jgi:hypothetical protein
MSNASSQLDLFLCAHSKDVAYLLELVVRSWQLHFVPKGRLFLISNDRRPLEEFADRLGLANVAEISTDADWLSKSELQLPGWYKQQIVKLRSYRICGTENFCNLGADTLLLKPVDADDLVVDGYPVTRYYRRPATLMDRNYRYELFRVLSVARMLQIAPLRGLRYVDFISDLFTFNRHDLIALDKRMHDLHGPDCYYQLLNGYGTLVQNQKRFGEWTLYTLFILDCLRRKPVIQDMSKGFLRQIYTQQSMDKYDFNSTVVHLVSKEFDTAKVRAILKDRLQLDSFIDTGAGCVAETEAEGAAGR